MRYILFLTCDTLDRPLWGAHSAWGGHMKLQGALALAHSTEAMIRGTEGSKVIIRWHILDVTTLKIVADNQTPTASKPL